MWLKCLTTFLFTATTVTSTMFWYSSVTEVCRLRTFCKLTSRGMYNRWWWWGGLLITWGMETWALNINSKASYPCPCPCPFYRLVVCDMQKVGVTGKTPAKREATTSCCEVQRIHLKQYRCFTNNNRLRLWKKFTLRQSKYCLMRLRCY